MSNEVTVKSSSVLTTYTEEADTLLEATEGHDKLLKFVKGKYKVRDDEVPLGTQYVVHANQLTYCWIKFRDKKRLERRMGKAVEKWIPPERKELDDNDQTTWEKGLDGNPKDPWKFQHLLPFEHLESGDVVIFVTDSTGGKIATEEIVREYARRLKRKGSRALPIVKLASKDMPTKAYGNVPRPHFEVDGWEDAPAGDSKQTAADELNDQVPF
jgi:hypothetical protein